MVVPRGTAEAPTKASEPWGRTQSVLHGGKVAALKQTSTTGGAAPGQGTTSGGTPPGQGSADQNNAYADLQASLQQYGLQSLASWAWNEIVNGATESQVVLDLYNQPAFKTRFPAIFTRQEQGLPPISPGDYVSYENQATQMFEAAGLPKGFWDSPSDFTNLISNDVSTTELQARLNLATQAAYQVPDSVRTVLQRDYGIGTGGLAAHFLDPTQAEPALAQQFLAAQIGGAGIQTGYGTDKATDEQLAADGVTAAAAQQGFTQLGTESQLFKGLPGQGESDISQADQVAAEFEGNVASQQAITARTQSRQAQFAASGSYQSSAAGFGGIGSAQQD